MVDYYNSILLLEGSTESSDRGRIKSLSPLLQKHLWFLHAWKKMEFFARMYELLDSQNCTYPLEWVLFSLLAHAENHLDSLHLTALCVGLPGGRVSLPPKPSLACLEWLASINLAWVDHSPFFCIEDCRQCSARCLPPADNEGSIDFLQTHDFLKKGF